MKAIEFMNRLNKELDAKLDMRRIFNADVLSAMGESAVEDMKAFIAGGDSTIEGRGEFPAYKNPDKYPGKRKPHSPVNLLLSGDFLNALHYRINQAKIAISIYYSDRKSKLKEQGHREGANKQPRRPTIPNEREKFRKAIMLNIDAIVNRALKKASNSLKSR